MDDDGGVRIGVAEEAEARRLYVEGHRKRTRPYLPAKVHRITVDCKTGKRTVESGIIVAKPAPKVEHTVVRRPEPQPYAKRASVPCAQIVFEGRAELRAIVGAVADAFGLTPQDLLARGRKPLRAQARYAAYLLLRDRMAWSLKTVGCAFCVDHTSVIAGLRRTERLRHVPDWRHRYEAAHIALAGGVC